MRVKYYIYNALSIVLLSSHAMAVHADTPQYQAPLFDNLGQFHYVISTNNPMAQRFFDQGLILFYGFEWGEAIRSFKEAARLDPHCGMCYWGEALALGNKVNAPMSGHEYADAKSAIQKALGLKSYETAKEYDLIKALALRFQHPPKKLMHMGVFSCHTSGRDHVESTQNEMVAYSKAMKKVSVKYPDDLDIKSLYAFSYFNQIEWLFWDPNHKINPVTPTVIKTLQEVLAKDALHAGANHYYVHVIEQSDHPGDAMDSADRLRTLVPGSEHLVHMPAHIYFLTAKYQEGSDANEAAIKAFQQYYKDCYRLGFEPEINYLYFHNYDFLRTTAVMQGHRDVALAAAKQIVDRPFPTWLAKEPYLQWFIPIQYYVEARFAMWPDILKEPKPDSQYQYALGMWHYARGLAYTHTQNINAAKAEENQLKAIVAKGGSDRNLGHSGQTLLKIANEILLASIADVERQGNLVISHLLNADNLQHGMGYHEPPDWYFPVKEVLGDAYLKWNKPKKAIEAYEADLKQYPKNGWALYGLASALRKEGKAAQAEEIERQYLDAWQGVTMPPRLIE